VGKSNEEHEHPPITEKSPEGGGKQVRPRNQGPREMCCWRDQSQRPVETKDVEKKVEKTPKTAKRTAKKRRGVGIPFKKRKSGNPKGRPKKDQKIIALQAVNDEVFVETATPRKRREPGKPRKTKPATGEQHN